MIFPLFDSGADLSALRSVFVRECPPGRVFFAQFVLLDNILYCWGQYLRGNLYPMYSRWCLLRAGEAGPSFLQAICSALGGLLFSRAPVVSQASLFRCDYDGMSV